MRSGSLHIGSLSSVLAVLCLALMAAASAQQNPAGLARPGTARVADRFSPLPPGAVRFEDGFMGHRIAANARHRLMQVDEDDLLDAFERRDVPHHPWHGEHVGKFLHAATLAAFSTDDRDLRAKAARVAARLIATQEADGYLGTYPREQRWTQWDVWSHKYALLGLLTHYQYTKNAPALAAARRVGDLLDREFGPGRRDINKAGEHMGMAATSVLEPMVLLYRATGEGRYLAFARWIVSNYDAPGGPAIVSSLAAHRAVNRVANAKAYEMLSNLNGLLELYRVTGEKRLLDLVRVAWDDIVEKRLYITGTASSGEFFRADHELPNGEGANIGETCVTVTWAQMNMHLLRLTGDPRFADELERTACNHLFGAQKPSGDQWAYYTPLEGRKPYGHSTNCCLSSGPRGVALLNSFAAMTTPDGGLAVNLYDAGTLAADLPSGRVRLDLDARYPLVGKVRVVVNTGGNSHRFPLRLRVPAWADGATATLNGEPVSGVRPGAYLTLSRTWRTGDVIVLNMPMRARFIAGEHGNAGKAAIARGPLVLALEDSLNPSVDRLRQVSLASDGPEIDLCYVGEAKGRMVFSTPGRAGVDQEPLTLQLTPFATAGQDGEGRYTVWIARPGRADLRSGSGSLFFNGRVTVSRRGNQEGDIADDDTSTFRVTYNGAKMDRDWFAVSRKDPVRIDRVTYLHGRIYHDGGWFDASAEKPRIEVREAPDGPWRTVGTLDDYPDTTATDAGGLRDNQPFTVTFAPVLASGIRVIGTPACGDDPSQDFASCAELQAFGPAAAPEHPIARGTFLQDWLVNPWTDDRWQAEIRDMKALGMHIIVFGSTVDGKARTASYPAGVAGLTPAEGVTDAVEACLRNAQKAGMRVFVGLNFHPDWWSKGADDPGWLHAQMREGVAIAGDLYRRYKARFPTAFHGWYWVWEVDNLRFNSPDQRRALAEALDITARGLKAIDPKMPVMLCPFMNHRLGTPEAYRDLWIDLFANCALGEGDIFAPQDCVGAGGLRLEDVEPWFRALKGAVDTVPGLRFWSDAETFTQEDWTSAPLDRFVAQMKAVQPYVDTIITFAWTHYYSPNLVPDGFQRTLAGYVETGRLETAPPTAPRNLRAVRGADGSVRLTWDAASDDIGVCGYYVYREGRLLSRNQVPRGQAGAEAPTTYIDTDGYMDTRREYRVQAYDYAGNVSAMVGPVTAGPDGEEAE